MNQQDPIVEAVQLYLVKLEQRLAEKKATEKLATEKLERKNDDQRC